MPVWHNMNITIKIPPPPTQPSYRSPPPSYCSTRPFWLPPPPAVLRNPPPPPLPLPPPRHRHYPHSRTVQPTERNKLWPPALLLHPSLQDAIPVVSSSPWNLYLKTLKLSICTNSNFVFNIIQSIFSNLLF